MDAYFAYVEDDAGAFRLVFESEPDERARRARARRQGDERVCRGDLRRHRRGHRPVAGESMLLASGLGGLAQVVARSWLHSDRSVPRDQAVQLLASLAWRGIAGFRCTETNSTTDRRLFPHSVRSWRARAEHVRSPHRANVCWVRRGKVAHFTERRRDIAVEVKIGVAAHASRDRSGERSERRGGRAGRGRGTDREGSAAEPRGRARPQGPRPPPTGSPMSSSARRPPRQGGLRRAVVIRDEWGPVTETSPGPTRVFPAPSCSPSSRPVPHRHPRVFPPQMEHKSPTGEDSFRRSRYDRLRPQVRRPTVGGTPS